MADFSVQQKLGPRIRGAKVGHSGRKTTKENASASASSPTKPSSAATPRNNRKPVTVQRTRRQCTRVVTAFTIYDEFSPLTSKDVHFSLQYSVSSPPGACRTSPSTALSEREKQACSPPPPERTKANKSYGRRVTRQETSDES